MGAPGRRTSDGVLVVAATPIGNPADASPRLGEALATADIVAAEDTRRTGQLLKHFGIKRPLLSYFQFNEAKRSEEILHTRFAGALVSGHAWSSQHRLRECSGREGPRSHRNQDPSSSEGRPQPRLEVRGGCDVVGGFLQGIERGGGRESRLC